MVATNIITNKDSQLNRIPFENLEGLEKMLVNAKPIISGLQNGMNSIIEKSIAKTKSVFLPKMQNIRALDNYPDLITSFFLRAYVYQLEGYDSQFGKNALEFDEFDAHSVSIGYEYNKELISTSRIVFDSELGLPSDKYCPEIEEYKKKGGVLEVSRTVVLPEHQKRINVLFDEIIACVNMARLNGIRWIFYASPEPVMKMYEKHAGGSHTLRDAVQYGNLNKLLYFRTVDVNNLKPKFEDRIKQRVMNYV